MLGVDKPTTGSLIIRKTGRGLVLEKDAPTNHLFPRKFLEREINDAVRMQIVVPVEPALVYEVTGFEGPDLRASLREGAEAPAKPKRRWFRRNK